MSANRGRQIVVIGAGVAGLSAAIHLAEHGYRVVVVEKNRAPGGRCGQIERDGFRFDTGPTLYVMPHLYAAEFNRLGIDPQSKLELQQVDPNYHLHFEDGSRLELTTDLARLGHQIDRIESEASEGLNAYLAEGRQHYEVAIQELVLRDFRHPAQFFNPLMLPLLFDLKAFKTHYQHMQRYFDDPRLKAAFTFQDMYMGLSPDQALATFSLMPYSELTHGVWYPRGGMYRVAQALYERAEQVGVEVCLNSPVHKIVVRDGQAAGVELETGDFLSAGIVLANADLPYVYHELLPANGKSEALDRKQYSCSTISFFWGLDCRIEGLQPHMLFLASDFLGGFEAIEQGMLPEKPSLYVHTPTCLDHTLAPPNCDSLVGIVPVGHLDANPQVDWQETRRLARKAVFTKLAAIGLTGVEEHIQFETCFTPASWHKRYNLHKGATHGLSHTLTQLGYMRPHNRHARYPNLYFAGASTHPGTGLPTVMVSGRLAAERIQDERPLE